MSYKNSEEYFFYLLVSYRNKDQNIALLKNINETQLKVFKRVASAVLDGVFHIDKKAFRLLSEYKFFLRKLRSGNVTRTIIAKNYIPISYLAKLAIEHHEVCEQTSSRSDRRVGKDEEDWEKRDSDSGSSEFSESSDSSQSSNSEQSGNETDDNSKEDS